jgi:hypothetical protein
MTDYKKSITVSKPASEVYAAITEYISDWWSNDLTGAAAQAGNNFTIAFGKTQKTFEIIKAIPNEQIIWKCVKAYIDVESLKNKAEWVGTKMIWTLNTHEQNTTLTFLHEGLNESLECFSVCEAGWNQFLASLQAYLIRGMGNPYLKATSNKLEEKNQQVELAN